MRKVADFLPFVLPFVPGCSNPQAKQAIVSACIEFCEQSMIAQNIQTETVVSGTMDYDVEVPAQMSLVRVMQVFYKGARLKPRSREMVVNPMALRAESIDDVTIQTGTPFEWFIRAPEDEVVTVYPRPDALAASTGGLTIVSALQPAVGATSVPDVLFDNYAEDIGFGAVARLVAVPGQSFSAPAAEAGFRKKFLDALSGATSVGRQGRVSAGSRVRRAFFAR